MAVLLSIHPRHACRIYAGSKTAEFRRTRMRVSPPIDLWIYETLPVGNVTGRARVERITYGDANELVWLERDLAERPYVMKYLAGTQLSTALHLSRVERLELPVSLGELGIARPPQSYCYLGETWATLRS
jgi:predicted transcriptional regulator